MVVCITVQTFCLLVHLHYRDKIQHTVPPASLRSRWFFWWSTLTPPTTQTNYTVLYHSKHTDHIKHLQFKFQTFQRLCSFRNESNAFSHQQVHAFPQRTHYKEIWIVFQLLPEETKAQMCKTVYSTVCRTLGMHSNGSVYGSCTPGLSRIIASASPTH